MFLVNPAGYVHDVDDDAAELLLEQGYRVADADEIANWYTAQGLTAPKAAPKATKAKPAKGED